MNELSLYFRYMRTNYLVGLQYKGWPMVLLAVCVTVITDPIALLLLFAHFGAMGDWTVDRVMLVYGIAFASFGLAELFARGYDYFPGYIRTGAFDRILLRPRSTFVQVVGMHFHLHRISKVVAGLLVIAWSLSRQHLTLTAGQFLQLFSALLGGGLAYTGVFVFTSAIAFWTIHSLNWIWVFTNGSYQVAKCPPQYMPRWLKNTFTFFVPMLVFSYYPAAAIGGWGINPAFGWLALPSGAIFFSLSLVAWSYGTKHYSSTGS